MKNEIKITVSGKFMTGKSHITYLIKKVLKDNGFSVKFEPDLDYGPSEKDFDKRVHLKNEEAIKGLSKKTKIKIEQIQLPRV